MKLTGQSQAVRGVARFQLRIEFVRCLEKRRVQCPPVALEAMAQRSERAVLVHPLAQVAENLLAGLVTVQCLQLGPLFRLRLADEGEYRLREDRAFAVKALTRYGYVPVRKQVAFDDSFEGGFGMTLAWISTDHV